MSNKLEEYLSRRRPELDVEKPDDDLIWEGIRQDLQNQVPVRKLWPRVRNWAAVIVILLSLGYVVADQFVERNPSALASIDRELGLREREYQEMLQVKLQEAGTYDPTVHNRIISELYEEIEKLDLIYAQCLKDLNDLGNDPQVIHTLFDTYEKKIYLLELIILETQKSKLHENDESVYL